MSEGSSVKERTSSSFLINSGIYYALHLVYERLGLAHSWGENTEIHKDYVGIIPEELRHKKPFRMLLLGSATDKSIRQSLDALKTWEEQDVIGESKLTVIDISRRGFNSLDQEIQGKVEFVQADISSPPFRGESFDFITSDYIFDFIDRNKTPQAIKDLSLLLTPGGVFDSAFTLKRIYKELNTFDFMDKMMEKIDDRLDSSTRRLLEEDLDKTIPSDCIKLPSQFLHSHKPTEASIVWGFQKTA